MDEVRAGAAAPAEGRALRPGRAPRRDTNPRRELVREELLDIAARMFDERGFDRVSMAMIASEVGLGRSALYHYFASKDDILAAMIESEARAPVARIRALATQPGLTAAERLRAVVEDGVSRRLSSGARFVRLGRLEAQIPKHLRGDYDRSRRAIYDQYVALIEEGIAAGELRRVDSHIAAFAIIGMANWTSRWFRPGGRLAAAEVAQAIADLALASVRAHDGEDSRIAAARARLRALAGEVDALAAALG